MAWRYMFINTYSKRKTERVLYSKGVFIRLLNALQIFSVEVDSGNIASVRINMYLPTSSVVSTRKPTDPSNSIESLDI